jgi:hypothetical protein
MARYVCALTTVDLTRLRVKMLTRFRVWTTLLMNLRTRIFTHTHLDLAFGFWQVQVRDQDTHKTAFQTLGGLMEWVAMPFGPCNAPATFQRMMNDILRDFLPKFVIVYLDDVCTYNCTLE